ncbi:GAF domain-containing protein [Calothrix sp. PCC 6303]|uniref:GAF domain-containing protein n=1 Tax=Calothrix sp. PCC 6303 TaxID=1170562 RepID=UPI0002A0357F|nr:GAF domain-containing protein [Calothrix sp. PCC 6303]AFZ03907.1 GAF domain protein [Calothrix sp. PCC 6303]
MEVGISLQEITELRKFGNTILTFSSVNIIVEETFLEIKRKLSPQVISIFLFSKDGFLERYEISGRDRGDVVIEASWLHDERYKPGESFSGKAAFGKPYGEPYWSNQLDKEVDNFTYGKEYSEKLGFLRCGISVPLNGTHRTFGTIEVVNKVNPETGRAHPSLVYSDSDVCWLALVGAHVAAAISRLRKKDEDKIFATIIRVLADPTLEHVPVHTTEESAYKTIANKLVDYLMPYKVCIVRLTFDGQSLFVTNKAHSDGDEKGWLYRVDEPRVIGQKIVGRVFQSGKYEIIEDIEIKEREDEFTNLEWIKSQNLKSFICFPLLILGKVIGTLSLFTGYIHEFTESDIDFLENVSFLLAAFRVRSRRIKEVEIPRDTATTDEIESLYYEKLPRVDTGLKSSNLISPEEIEFLIKEAVDAGISDDDLEELREHLADVRNGRLTEEAPPTVVYQEVEDKYKIRKDCGKEIIISTAPGLDDDFDGAILKEIKRPPSSSSDTGI